MATLGLGPRNAGAARLAPEVSQALEVAFPDPVPVVCHLPTDAPDGTDGAYDGERAYVRRWICAEANAFAGTFELPDRRLNALLLIAHEQSHHRWPAASEHTTNQHAVETVPALVRAILPKVGYWRLIALALARGVRERAVRLGWG